MHVLNLSQILFITQVDRTGFTKTQRGYKLSYLCINYVCKIKHEIYVQI